MKEDRILCVGEYDDLLDALNNRTTIPAAEKFGVMSADISEGKLWIVLEIDLKKAPHQFTIFPQNFFKNWIRDRITPKS